VQPEIFQGSSDFESEAHKAQFARCLWAGVVPPKFSYSGSAAYSHAALASTDGYRTVTNAVELEVGMVRSHLSLAGECQIAEIGPGSGGHTVALIGGISSASDGLGVRYLGLDFSATLLGIARPVLKSVALSGLEVATWDIDEGPTDAISRWRSSGMVLAVMVGNTLANLDDPVTALRNIRVSLKVGDALLLSVNLADDQVGPEEMTSPYRTPEFRATVLEPFRAAGIDIDACKFDILYQDHEVMAFVTLGADYQHDQGVLPAGWRIRSFRSRRFSGDIFRSYLTQSGFLPSDIHLRRTGGLVVALARM
jgi:Histidine-specific methyltransferase, SAM-dependent